MFSDEHINNNQRSSEIQQVMSPGANSWVMSLLRTLGRGNRHTEPHGLMSPQESLYIMVCVHEITFVLACSAA
jgi:hypothetical protein